MRHHQGMRHRVPLPRLLGEQFSVRDAEAIGIRPGRCSTPDLHRPFRGVRSLQQPATLHELMSCYLPRLKHGQRFGGTTAARAWGLPLPTAWHRSEPLDIVVPTSGAIPHTPGVSGHRMRADRAQTMTLNGHPVVDPVAALFMCAAGLTTAQAVVTIDALLTTASNYPDLGPGRPLSTIEEITQRLDQWWRFPGSGTIRAAVPLARSLVESPKETETRLILLSSGVPEPVVQYEVSVGGRFLGRVDLAYPHWKIAIEHEGDGHRIDRDQWRIDIQRQRYLESEGWIVIRLTQADLVAKDLLLASIHRAIVRRQQ